MITKLTKNFYLEEAAVSSQFPELAEEIKFTETDKVKLYYLYSCLLEQVRAIDNKPIITLSGKRTPELNKAVKGVKNSDHLFEGFSCAVDFYTKDKNRLYIILRHLLWDFNCAVGEAILYFTKNWNPRFIHLSLPTPRHQHDFFYDYNNGQEFKRLIDLPDKVYIRIFNEFKDK